MRMIKSKKVRWLVHKAPKGGKRNAYTFVVKSDIKIPVKRHRHRRTNNNKMEFSERVLGKGCRVGPYISV
jgi:hypothetical protein